MINMRALQRSKQLRGRLASRLRGFLCPQGELQALCPAQSDFHEIFFHALKVQLETSRMSPHTLQGDKFSHITPKWASLRSPLTRHSFARVADVGILSKCEICDFC